MADDDRSVAALVAAAREFDPDDWDYQDILTRLWRRSNRETFDAADALSRSDLPNARRLGVDVLSHLGIVPPARPFADEALPILLRMSGEEQDAAVLAAVVSALAHQGREKGLPGILRHAGHPAVSVRLWVATSMAGADDPSDPAPGVVAAYLQLMADEDPVVRDWATFGIGTQLSVDTPQVRDALLERSQDVDGIAAGEAMRALASRGDRRCVPVLAERLQSVLLTLNGRAEPTGRYDPDELAFDLFAEAAATLADPLLLPMLLGHHLRCCHAGRDGGYLDAAIDACGRDLLFVVVQRHLRADTILRVHEDARQTVVEVVDTDGAVLVAATAPTGVLAALMVEQRWCNRNAGQEPAPAEDDLLRAHSRLCDLSHHWSPG